LKAHCSTCAPIRAKPWLQAAAGFAENAAVGNGLFGAGMEVVTKPFAMLARGNKVRETLDRKTMAMCEDQSKTAGWLP
jgi:hypothetical protein